MTAYSTKGTLVSVLKGSATATNLVPTAITKAAPAVVTVASAAAVVAGDIISIPATGLTGSTGFPELDGKTWIAGTVTGTTISLLGSNTVGSSGALIASPRLECYNSADVVTLDVSAITFNPDPANSVSVATFGDPSASLPSQLRGAGTVDVTGYTDISNAGFKELNAMEDGLLRRWRIKLGGSQGYVVFDGILTGLTPTVPIDGATSFSATINLTSKFRHLY